MDDKTVEILWGAEEAQGGWLPYYTRNGKRSGAGYSRPMDRDTARRAASAGASDEAERYRGDWTVTVKEEAERVGGIVRKIRRQMRGA